ncbi:hypothetical protein CPC08DRAFT_753718 [Agrocybe pediades]|nr:hypothetical protein CPC08DRAFT_753718 [Agrocybe pediades]
MALTIYQWFRRIRYRLFVDNKLLYTVKIFRHFPRPWYTIWKLLWPFPWKYRLEELMDPMEIKSDPNIVHHRYYVEENYRLLRGRSLFRARDTPLRSLYRLHDVLCADEENYIMLEADYFWRHGDWKTKHIPDPKDPNPFRYAILAALVEVMVEEFNYKISLGMRRGVRYPNTDEEMKALRDQVDKPYEEVPPWAASVPGLDEWITFDAKGRIYKGMDPFERRRICANPSQIGNI